MKAALLPTAQLYPTRNDIRQPLRSRLIELLNARLADAIDLQTQTKTAHWNVKGPGFIALHELFDRIHGSVTEYVDLLAERAVQLGGVAEGTARAVAARSELDDYPLDIAADQQHVHAMADALGAFGSRVRRAIGEAEDLHDPGTTDLFTEISRGIDRWLWLVEAHLQA